MTFNISLPKPNNNLQFCKNNPIESTSYNSDINHDIKTTENVNIEKTKQKSKNRCNYNICKTKLGLIPFECRCQMNFCAEHRLPENHNCAFDYKTLGKIFIEKNNQKIIGDKILKI